MFESLRDHIQSVLQSLHEIMILGNGLDQIVVAFVVIVLGWGLARVLSYLFSHYATKLVSRTLTSFDDFTVAVLQRAVAFIVVILAFKESTEVLTLAEGVNEFIGKAVVVLLAYKVTDSLLRVFDFVVKHYVMPYAVKSEILDKTIFPTLERIVKLIVWAIVILLVVSNMGYNISSLLAGLGIGGLAFALGAQEALSNFFGSISIFADKTFKVGDFVKIGESQGTITSVGLRSTRLETEAGTELIIPNSQIASQTIENLSRRPRRRVDLEISLAYETTNTKLKQAMKLLKTIVADNKDTLQNCRVYLHTFGDSGLMFTLTYWIKTLDYAEGLKIQSTINLKIKAEFEKAGIVIPYPTRTIHIEK